MDSNLQVRHEATKKELALVKDELSREMKRNEEVKVERYFQNDANPSLIILLQLQQEASRLLSSWSRAQKNQQEYDQQLQEVRGALKRKTEDLELIKVKLSDEVRPHILYLKNFSLTLMIPTAIQVSCQISEITFRYIRPRGDETT